MKPSRPRRTRSLNLVADPFACQAVLDGSPDTHWSRYGMGQWLKFEMESAAGVPTVEAVEIQFYQGRSRVQFFEVTNV